MHPEQIAINTNAFKKEPLINAIRFIDSLGCHSIEVTTDGRAHAFPAIENGNLLELPDWFDVVCLSGGWVDFFTGETSFLWPQLEFAKRSDIPLIRLFVSNPHIDVLATEENIKKAAFNARKAAITASLFYPEVTILFENHGGILFDDSSIKEFFFQADSPNTGLVFDPANFEYEGVSSLDVLKEIWPLVRHVHVKDVLGYHGEFCSIGEGIVPWDRILTFLDRVACYPGYFSIEYEGRRDPKKGLESSFRNFLMKR